MILTFSDNLTDAILEVDSNDPAIREKVKAFDRPTDGGESTLHFDGDENELFECSLELPMKIDQILSLYECDTHDNEVWERYIAGRADGRLINSLRYLVCGCDALSLLNQFAQDNDYDTYNGEDEERLGMEAMDDETFKMLENHNLIPYFNWRKYWEDTMTEEGTQIDTENGLFVFHNAY